LADSLQLLQLQTNSGVFEKSCKGIYKLARHSGASITSEKCLGPPGTPGVFYKSNKKVYKLARHSGASATSEKCLGPPGTPGVFLKIIQRYLAACQTFWSFYYL